MDWVNGFILMLGGAVIGGVIVYLARTERQKDQVLSKRLDEVHSEFAAYQQSVDAHFAKTAELVNKLSEDYIAVHQHLSQGAQTLVKHPPLASNQQFNAIESQIAEQAAIEADKEPLSETDLEPPKDYAPKHSPKEAGTLSEKFGLKGEPEENLS